MNGNTGLLIGGPFISGIVVLGLTGSSLIETNSAAAQPVGGGNTCTPHSVTQQVYVAGHFEGPFYIPGKLVTKQFMSTRCGPTPPSYNPGNLVQALSGNWYHNGLPTSIAPQQGNSLLFTNEEGNSATGYIEGPRFVFSPEWGVSGQIVDGGTQINWSNGTVWTRDITGRLLY